MANPLTTTVPEHVRPRFSRSPRAVRELQAWRADEHKRDVWQPVLSHRSETVNALQPKDVLEVCKRIASATSEHALGDIQKRDVDAVPTIRDWHPPFALMHILHFALEGAGELLTWREFEARLREDRTLVARYVTSAEHAVREAVDQDHVSEPQARRALQWRLGLAYYAMLKEQFVMAVLRAEGLEVRYHPLADVLFKVDCWVGDTNVDIYVSNPRFRAGVADPEGRKNRAEILLSDAEPPFEYVVLELATQHTYGDVHLPSQDQVARQLALLHRAGRIAH